LGQGKENSRNYLIENEAVANEIEQKIKAKLGIGVPRAVADLPADVADEVVDIVEAPVKAVPAKAVNE
jgi:recombination protein RecA